MIHNWIWYEIFSVNFEVGFADLSKTKYSNNEQVYY